MCGRFTLVVPSADDLAQALGVEISAETRAAYRPRYNVAPTDPHWVLRMKNGVRELMGASFGLVPRWAKSTADRAKAINARSETIASMPKFRDAFARRRCVVVADGFLEWRSVDGAKRPLWFTPKRGGLLPMAGIYEKWSAPDGSTLRTFSIVTTAANDFMRDVHDRMPVLLTEAEMETWMGGPYATDDGRAPAVTDEVRALLRPAPNDFLLMTPVSSRVNSVRNDDPACLLTGEEEPPPEKKRRAPRRAPKPAEELPLFAQTGEHRARK
ncbi:MAG: SOS response-associated peptidase [Polyangiaceae bacterium]